MALADKARGQRIAELRKRKRLTQQVMAERLKIAYRTYQTWEAGTMPEWPNLERLAAELGARVEDIIGEDPSTVSVMDALSGPQGQLDRIEDKLDAILEAIRKLAAADDDDQPADALAGALKHLDPQEPGKRAPRAPATRPARRRRAS